MISWSYWIVFLFELWFQGLSCFIPVLPGVLTDLIWYEVMAAWAVHAAQPVRPGEAFSRAGSIPTLTSLLWKKLSSIRTERSNSWHDKKVKAQQRSLKLKDAATQASNVLSSNKHHMITNAGFIRTCSASTVVMIRGSESGAPDLSHDLILHMAACTWNSTEHLPSSLCFSSSQR